MDVAAVRARRRRSGGGGLRPGRRGDGLDRPAHRLVELLRLRHRGVVRHRPAARSRPCRTRGPGSRPYAHALETGWGTAIGRMVTEATAIGADGIVGVRLSQSGLGNDAHEFTAIGTGVRARCRTRPQPRVLARTSRARTSPSSCLRAGCRPISSLGIAVGIRHDDWNTRQQRTWSAGNVEVGGYTELIHQTRADARSGLRRARPRPRAPMARSSTPCASTPGRSSPPRATPTTSPKATIFGTAHRPVPPLDRGRPTRSLTYLPLKRSRS